MSADETTPGEPKGRSEDGEQFAKRLAKATGTSARFFPTNVFAQIVRTLTALSKEGEPQLVAGTLEALEGIAPRGEAEAMLAAQMISTHHVLMECLRQGANSLQNGPARDYNLKQAAKFMQLYLRQLEVLDKRQGHDQQNITVGHMTVKAGGQAIVGHVHTLAPVLKPAAAASPRPVTCQVSAAPQPVATWPNSTSPVVATPRKQAQR